MLTRQISKEGKESFKQNCYPLWNNETNNFKNKEQIVQEHLCVPGKNNKKFLYFKNNKSYYPFLNSTLNSCITNYNQYNNNPDINHLDVDELIEKCDINYLNSINSDYVKLIKYVNNLSKQVTVLPKIHDFLVALVTFTNISYNEMIEVMNGAYVIINNDNGYIYNKFFPEKEKTYKSDNLLSRTINYVRPFSSRKCHGVCNTRARVAESSHETMYDFKQYRYGEGVIFGIDDSESGISSKSNSVFDLLVGRCILPDFYGDTWFQFEEANISNWWNQGPLHGLSFVKYKIKEKNIGPLGESKYTEYTEPFIINFCEQNCDINNDSCEIKQCITKKEDSINNILESENWNRDNDIFTYKEFKNFIKKHLHFSKGYFSLQNLLTELTKYSNQKYFNTQNVEITIIPQNLLEILTLLAEEHSFYYTMEQLIEITFLIIKYSKLTNANNIRENTSEIIRLIEYRNGESRKTQQQYEEETSKESEEHEEAMLHIGGKYKKSIKIKSIKIKSIKIRKIKSRKIKSRKRKTRKIKTRKINRM